MKRPYAAGLAILVTLLLSSVVAAEVDWVYLGDVEQKAAPPAVPVPYGAAAISLDPIPNQPSLTGGSEDLDYIYLWDNGTGGNYIPWWGNSFTRLRAQYLYLASEINKTGTIAQLGLFKNYWANYYNTFQNTSVKLCHTTVTALVTNWTTNYGGNTPVWVYHGDLYRGCAAAAVYDTLALTTNFAYNGTSNLIVEVLWSGRTAAVGIPSYTGNSTARRAYNYNDTTSNPLGVDGAINACRLGFLGLPNDVGVTKIIAPSDPFYAFGETLKVRAQVRNFGLNNQTNVKVRAIMKDKVTSAVVYHESAFVDLTTGQYDTIDFPDFAPPAVENIYVDTMRTEMAGDQVPGNDWKANEVKITAWGAECMTYNDGTFDNAYSWVAAGNQMAVRFFSPTKPLGVNKVEIYLSSFSGSSYASEVRIFANDGTPYGYPGTRLATWVGNLNTLIWTSLYKNEIMFDPAVSVNYDTFFASYYQTSITPLYPYLGVDYTPPVTVGNDWGQYNGTWGLWPYDGNQDMGINACYQAPLIDGGVVAINYPTPEIDSNTNVTPIVTVQNKGLKDRSNMVVVFDLQDSTGAVLFTDTVNTGLITRGGTKQATFNRNYTPHPGDWTDSAYTIVQWDGKPENDWFVQPLFVKHLNVKTEILSPRIQEVPGLVPVNIRLTNMGNVPVTVPRLDVKINPSGYSDYRENIAIAVGANQIVSLNSWVCPAGGQETCTAYITYGADMYRPDDTMIRPIRTGIPGWTEMTALPAPPSGKFVKDGGCLAYDAGTDLIYASKGNKTGDFYACDVNADVAWTNKTGIPLGAEGKPPYKGSVVCADGTGKLYLTKGNNTVGFWGYDAGTNAWTQLTNVPLGSSGKKVKQGCGLAWGTKNDVGYVYMLKGYRNEFHKYDPATNQWVQLLDAPIGSANHIKWDAGSWLVADAEPDGHLLYAFKSKYHEMYTYDTDADTWSHAKVAMPIPGSAGNKKAKDGSCAAWYSGKIYAFKGGNTVEFWRYFPLGDSWHKQDDIPLWGQSGSRKKVKAGAALAGYPGMGIFAFKGNKSNEFWRYTPYEVAGAQPSRDGVTAGVTEIGSVGFAIAPNPLAGGFATVRYSLPKAGLATLNVFDVTGRTVLEQTLVAGRTGTASLDLRKLEAGVYLVKVTTEGFSTTQKLVVEH